MADDKQIQEINEYYNFLTTDDDSFIRIYRESLGDESRKETIEPLVEKSVHLLEQLMEVQYEIDNSSATAIITKFKTTTNKLKQIRDLNSSGYLQNADNIINEIRSDITWLRGNWALVITLLMEKKGVLDIISKIDDIEGSLKHLENTKEEIQNQCNKLITNAKQEADVYIEKAQKTARKISVKAAQEQFSSANKSQLIQMGIWALLSVGSFVFFGVFAWYLAFELEPTGERWDLVYYSAIRISILTAIGAFTTYCLKILKAHIHMYNHNQHRIRVTNSIEAFVVSASTKEQSDAILIKLVDAVVSFGNSGLVQNDEDRLTTHQLVIDTVQKGISDK